MNNKYPSAIFPISEKHLTQETGDQGIGRESFYLCVAADADEV
jgi:hypothetical protein